jgi:MYXO-CTERM domain-containing protein
MVFVTLLSLGAAITTRTWAQPDATAQAADAEQTAGELRALELTLDGLIEQASGECIEACRALGLMMRAAEHICDLDPGERCLQARAKVEAARRRVQERCPDCAAAEKKAKDLPDTKPAPLAGAAGDDGDEAPREVESIAAAPPAEDASAGGCAACAIGQRDAPGRGLVGWLLLAAAVVVRRRRQR